MYLEKLVCEKFALDVNLCEAQMLVVPTKCPFFPASKITHTAPALSDPDETNITRQPMMSTNQ